MQISHLLFVQLPWTLIFPRVWGGWVRADGECLLPPLPTPPSIQYWAHTVLQATAGLQSTQQTSEGQSARLLSREGTYMYMYMIHREPLEVSFISPIRIVWLLMNFSCVFRLLFLHAYSCKVWGKRWLIYNKLFRIRYGYETCQYKSCRIFVKTYGYWTRLYNRE